MKLPIYLDYSATTPCDIHVVKKMMQYLTFDGIFGNPSSRSHCYGWQAEEAVDIARNNIASLIGASAREIIFTSGATESNNLALKGIAHANSSKGRHIITAVTEHKAVLDTCLQLEREGFTVTRLVPMSNGIITPEQLNEALNDNTILVSLMHVNNETGVMQDIATFGNLCHARGIIFHVDATQSVGKVPINLAKLKVDLMSFSSHKIYGPKGIGGLFICNKSNIQIEAQIHGGGHEYGIRSGTLPVHQIVGMGEAYRLAANELINETVRLRNLRNRLWKGLQQIDGVVMNSNLEQGVTTILNVSFRNINSKLLILSLKDLAISTGSACTSSVLEPSYVLRAMGLNEDLAYSSIRFSLGRFTTSEEIDFAITKIQAAIPLLRKSIF